MFRWFKDLFKDPPKYRLVPNSIGTYTLERWDTSLSMYLCAAVHVNKEESELVIERLEGKILYYTEEK